MTWDSSVICVICCNRNRTTTQTPSVRAGGFSFRGLVFAQLVYRVHGLQIKNVLLKGQNLQRLVTGRFVDVVLNDTLNLTILAIWSTRDTIGRQMKIIRSKEFTADRPWGALDIANMNGITTRLHWTDQPYKWHINDGQEVFAVLDGRVEMRYRVNGLEQSTVLDTGDIFYASIGAEHVAHPIGQARILVIETAGSV